MQNIDREPLFCTLFAEQKSVQFCISLSFSDCYDEILIKLKEIVLLF